MRSPVLFLIFNHPALARSTFACIREARPPRLNIAADGPREGHGGETALCEEAREAVTRIDWPCEVKTLFRKRNLGCADAVSSAITWFFRQRVEETGWLAPVGDVDGLVAGIEWVKGVKNDAKVRLRCRAFALEQWNAPARARDYAELFRELGERGRAQQGE